MTVILNISNWFCFLKTCLLDKVNKDLFTWQRETARARTQGGVGEGKQASHQAGSPMQGWTPGPWDHLSWRQNLTIWATRAPHYWTVLSRSGQTETDIPLSIPRVTQSSPSAMTEAIYSKILVVNLLSHYVPLRSKASPVCHKSRSQKHHVFRQEWALRQASCKNRTKNCFAHTTEDRTLWLLKKTTK